MGRDCPVVRCASGKVPVRNDRAAFYLRGMRAMFAIYLIGIFGGIGYFIVIGLSHH
jgi:hypothetical protein